MKLRQTGSVAEYRAEFEKLMNRVDWRDNTLLECFISGLKDYIRDEVLSYQPSDLTGAIRLARIQEDKFSRRKTSTFSKPGVQTASSSTGGTRKPLGEGEKKGEEIKKLSLTELQDKRAKGLCFNCDEKYVRGHQCKKPQLFMINQEFDELEVVKPGAEGEEDTEVDLNMLEFGVSLQAMEGGGTDITLRLPGHIVKRQVTMLIDTGSTHNFINPQVARRLKHPITKGTTFQVMVADDTRMVCEGTLKGVTFRVQDY